jgi:phosphate/sulfate permease
MKKKKVSNLTFVRLCLSGAIAGVALFNLVAPHFGIDASHVRELVGGALGAGTVAAFKFTHVI